MAISADAARGYVAGAMRVGDHRMEVSSWFGDGSAAGAVADALAHHLAFLNKRQWFAVVAAYHGASATPNEVGPLLALIAALGARARANASNSSNNSQAFDLVAGLAALLV